MRLLPRMGQSDPVADEIRARKRALKDARRRRIATPLGSLNPDQIPPDAVVFKRPSAAPEVTEIDEQAVELQEPEAAGERLDTPPEVAAERLDTPPEVAAEQLGTPPEVSDEQLDIPPDFLRKAPEAPKDTVPATEAKEAAAAPIAALGPDLEKMLAEAAPGAKQAVEASLAGLEPEPEKKRPEAAAGADGLDIFREAKTETTEGNLASEVEDISMADLLGDLSSIRTRLGVPERAPIVRQVHTEALADVAPDEEPLPELKIEKIVPQPVAEDQPPEIEAVEEPDIDIDSLLSTEPEAPPPATPSPQTKPPAPPKPPKGGVDGPMLLHVLFLGLALTAAGAFGVTRIGRPGTAAGADGTENVAGIVLAVVTTPHPTFAAVGTKAPASPTPSPEPTPSPTPKPPKVKDPSIPPAFHDYQIEYGDSLTSIAMGFGICPDHLLWANNRDEETPLMAGEYLTIPDGVGVVHTVRRGDTLSSIARLYNSTVEAITGVAGNQLATSDDLITGDQIFVPGGIPQSALDMGSKAEKMMTRPSPEGLVWPFFGPITTYYGEVRVGYIHNAIDIGGLGHYGASVNAIADGTVAFVGNDGEYGQNVIVTHADGSRSRYAHFSQTYVSQGQSVSQGQALGALGCSGDSTGTHLHFELWHDGKPVDPLLFLS